MIPNIRLCTLLCLELGCLATWPTRGLLDRTPAPPPAALITPPPRVLARRSLGGDDGEVWEQAGAGIPRPRWWRIGC